MRITLLDDIPMVDPVDWSGETPYFLVINEGPTNEPITHSWVVDLDETKWHDQRPDLMRAESEWVLVAKRDATHLHGSPVLALRVLPGEQPYYVKRTVGVIYGTTDGGTITLFGIGKKRLDGHVDRLWILPNGVIVPGDDGDIIATRMLKSQGEGPASS